MVSFLLCYSSGGRVFRGLAVAEAADVDVAGIGVSGQQHGLVALDADDRPVRPAKLWNDTTTTADCAALTERMGGEAAVHAATGNIFLPGYTAPKVEWLRRNEPDAYALEESLRLKEKHSGEVVVCSAGPARVAQVMREALARGADRAIHVEDDRLGNADAFTVSDALASAMKDEKFDLAAASLEKFVELAGTADGCSCEPYNSLAYIYIDATAQYERGADLVRRAVGSGHVIAPEYIARLEKRSRP